MGEKWEVLNYANSKKGYIAIVANGTEHVADVFPFGARPGGAQRELAVHIANARLIAAAPEILEALKAQMDATARVMRSAGYTEYDISDCTAQARAAIAKAEGARAQRDMEAGR